jgi:hypothetical protein
MTIASEINEVLRACDKVPLAQRKSIWVQAWDAGRNASAALKKHDHTEARRFIREAKLNLKEL